MPSTPRTGSWILFTFLLFLFSVAHTGLGQEVTLQWDPSPEAAVDGYRIYFGQASGSYTESIDVGQQTDATIGGLQAGSTYYFTATAYDLESNVESAFSNEIDVLIPDAPTVPPTAAFEATPTSGSAPLAVDFVDTSSGDVDAWSWDFGDGTKSTAEYPTHTYPSPGLYTVTLTVTGPGGSDSETKAGLVDVTAAPAAQPAMTFPAPGSTLTGRKVMFRWSANGVPVRRWRVQIGSVLGGQDLFSSGNMSPSRTKVQVRRLPTDGRELFLRLWYRTAAGWSFLDVTYRAVLR